MDHLRRVFGSPRKFFVLGGLGLLALGACGTDRPAGAGTGGMIGTGTGGAPGTGGASGGTDALSSGLQYNGTISFFRVVR